MSDSEDYSSENDEDYVPSGHESVSEEEGSGDEEALTEGGDKSTSRKKEKKKEKDTVCSRKRKGGIKLEDEDSDEVNEDDEGENEEEESLEKKITEEKEQIKEEKQKAKADSLWADFLKDVGQKPKPKPAVSTGLGSLSATKKENPSASTTSPTVTEKPAETTQKITVTKVFDFAGEEVRVTKEVDVNSKDALELKKKEEEKIVEKPNPAPAGIKRTSGGLGSVLGKIGKKPKMSTLTKSAMDWQSFKKDEGIDEELQIHNRGKEGYLERQAFLQRADVRQFELERDMRLGTSSKR